MDVPINLVQWEVFLPEQFKVKDFGGDVTSANLVPPALQEEAMLDAGTAGATELYRPSAGASGYLNISLPGQLGGIVTDPSGAVVAGATVTVTSQDTGFSSVAATNQAGLWSMLGVPSGRLTVRVEYPGFNAYQVRDLAYDANRPGAINATLSLGAAKETVEVSGESEAVNGRNMAEFGRLESQAKKQARMAQNAPSSNVMNLQRRVAGVLPVAVDVPRSGVAFHFVRPLVVDEETKVTFGYKSK